MEQMGHRKGEMTNMEVDGKGRIRIEATVPSRGLIGFRSEFMTMTSGTGIMTSSFSHYGPMKAGHSCETSKRCVDFYGSRYLPGLCTVHACKTVVVYSLNPS